MVFMLFLFAAMCMGFPPECSHGEQAQTAAPQTTEPAHTEAMKLDDGCDALFYGDSITKGNHFDEFFPWLRIVDFGINGATIEQLTERVPEVSACHPAKIFVMAGGNNLDSHNADKCVELFRGLLDSLREACPDAEIFIESMLPIGKSMALKYDCPNRTIRDFNKRLADLADEYGMTYLDIYPEYEYLGGLNSEMTRDGIHLKEGCFGPWAEVLRPYLEP